MASRRSPVVAVEAGRVEKPSWSSSDCALILEGKSGTEYWYMHLNNDLTRSDDNRGGCKNGVSFAPGLKRVQQVRAGQLIGFVGNSGNAAGGMTHLHFELHPNGGRAVSPYDWLRRGPRLLYAVPQSVTSVRLALFGRLRAMEAGVSVRVTRIAVARGWRGPTVGRNVSFAMPPEAVVERKSENGKVGAAARTGAMPGERVTVWTTWFAPSLATQLAGPNVLSAATVRLRGDAG